MSMRTIIFSELPVHDTLWSITTGRDGKIYLGVCGERTGGLSVFIVSYDPDADKVEYLIDVAEELNDPPDSGRATQSKIHYCLLPSNDGTLYGATHCTGPPIGDPIWLPWNCWDGPIKMFSGFHIFHYDPKTGDFEDFGVQAPNEGSRAMALSDERRKLYGVTYPRNHFYIYDLEANEYRDLGRIGDINPQSVFLDREENVYTLDDVGYIIKYDADRDELIHLGTRIPHGIYSQGIYFNTVYDTVPSPEGDAVYGTTYGPDNRLWRYDFYEGPEGKMWDLGHCYGPEYALAREFYTGGLVFGEDNFLYMAPKVFWKEPKGAYLVRVNTKTLERKEIGLLALGGHRSMGVSKATRDYAGNLYFANITGSPTRMYVYSPDYEKKGRSAERRWPIVRKWG